MAYVGMPKHAAPHRGHRIPPQRIVTFARRPSSMRRDGRKLTPDLPDGASCFFFTEGLDRANRIELAQQISRDVHALRVGIGRVGKGAPGAIEACTIVERAVPTARRRGQKAVGMALR